ncbi:helix-turn-helix domain-containing protein [Acidithiobacillus ferriphilus]|nr:helix-turn-helix domain-containing protein [Acidithiobacillus ferriphilus]MBU2846684.1 helix-turn-helix domain-containing protein [Acidithiobacillus ferriphilus]
MDIQTYLKSLGNKKQRHEFALRCGTTLGHLQNVSYGLRPCSPQLAVAIEQQSADAVTRKELLPDTWHLIWPELRPDIFHPKSPTHGNTSPQAQGPGRESA